MMSVPVLLVGLCVVSAHVKDDVHISKMLGEESHLERDPSTVPDPSAAIEQTIHPIKPEDATGVFDGPAVPWQQQWNSHILMAPDQLQKIMSVVRPDSNVLVFGAGYDSKLWSSGPNMVQSKGMAPPSGRTLILEDDPLWIQRVNDANPEVDVRPVGYHTTLLDQQRYKDDEELLKADFPVEQLAAGKDTRAWDVVIVDAPQAFMKTNPGRMKSIYWASKLVKNTGYVFVHDFNRGTEQWFANKYLVPELDQGCSADEATMKGKKGDLGCFGPAKDAKARDEEFATSWLSAKGPEAAKAKPL